MTERETADLALVRAYRAALEGGESGEPLARFFNLDAGRRNDDCFEPW